MLLRAPPRSAVFAALALVSCDACDRRELWPGPKPQAPTRSAIAATPSGAPGSLNAFERPPGPHPRILLTNERLHVAGALRDANAPSWRKLVEQCDEEFPEAVGCRDAHPLVG